MNKEDLQRAEEDFYGGRTPESRNYKSTWMHGAEWMAGYLSGMREALKPFAKMFEELTEEKVRQKGIVFQYNDAVITVEDLYTAFKALGEDSYDVAHPKILTPEQVKTAYQLLVGFGEKEMNEFLLASKSNTDEAAVASHTSTSGNSIEQEAHDWAEANGYYQSDKTRFETTPWTQYNIAVKAFKAGKNKKK